MLSQDGTFLFITTTPSKGLYLIVPRLYKHALSLIVPAYAYFSLGLSSYQRCAENPAYGGNWTILIGIYISATLSSLLLHSHDIKIALQQYSAGS